MRNLLVGTVAALAALAMVVVAFAHAAPKTVIPGDGAVLSTRPRSVVIETVEDMARVGQANDIQVFDSAGKQVTTQPAVIADNDRSNISVPLPSDLPVGTYTVKWKTLSATDGDAASGTFTFTYDPSRPPTQGKVNVLDVAGASPSTTGAARTPGTAAATNVATGVPATVSATAAGAAINSFSSGSPGGTPWVLVVAVGVGMLALGSGGTFLFVKKGP